VPGHTGKAVELVQKAWQNDPDRYDQTFQSIGDISKQARDLILKGNHTKLGPLMDENHKLLQELGVSTPELDKLVLNAKQAGALGAKLSGGGLGGNIIALVEEGDEQIAEQLSAAGAAQTLIVQVSQSNFPE
jgi:mevalonate kinase